MTATTATKLYPWLLAPPEQSFFLFGPRGSGKSTWAKGAFPSAYRFDLLDEGLYQELLTATSRSWPTAPGFPSAARGVRV